MIAEVSPSGGAAATAASTASASSPGDVMGGLFLLQLQQVELMDTQLLQQQDDMKARNDRLKALNDFMSELRSARPSDPKGSARLSEAFLERAKELGVTPPSGIERMLDGDGQTTTFFRASQAHIDAFIANAKGQVDMASNESQVDMIRLNSLVGKRNRTFEMISNLQGKVSQTLGTLVRNMG